MPSRITFLALSVLAATPLLVVHADTLPRASSYAHALRLRELQARATPLPTHKNGDSIINAVVSQKGMTPTGKTLYPTAAELLQAKLEDLELEDSDLDDTDPDALTGKGVTISPVQETPRKDTQSSVVRSTTNTGGKTRGSGPIVENRDVGDHVAQRLRVLARNILGDAEATLYDREDELERTNDEWGVQERAARVLNELD